MCEILSIFFIGVKITLFKAELCQSSTFGIIQDLYDARSEKNEQKPNRTILR